MMAFDGPAAEPQVPVLLLELGAEDDGGAVPRLGSIGIRELLGRFAVKIVTAVMNTGIDQPDSGIQTVGFQACV